MRPTILNPYFAPITALKGIGPRNGLFLARLLGHEQAESATVRDLLFHLPSGAVDRRNRPQVAGAPPGAVVTLEIRVLQHLVPPRGRDRIPYRVICEDETGEITLVYFNARQTYLEQILPVGEIRFVSGRLDEFRGEKQIVHPDYAVDAAAFAELPPVEATYPLTKGVSNRQIAKALAEALKSAADLPEWLDPALLAQRNWPSFEPALEAVHHPETPAAITPESAPFERLAYDEALANQLAILLIGRYVRRRCGKARTAEGRLSEAIEAALPYTLTKAQREALSEIRADIASPERMLRLLQGDVGSGKTVVALLAMAAVVEAGGQGALMAPTEILARQHYEGLQPVAKRVGLRIALLLGRGRGGGRQETLNAIENGEADIVIGTHALFQEGVQFKDLGLAVVDEQHRFGVHQRLALAGKADGPGADVLVMSATPIPRTLQLTFFGDMDVSSLKEKPPGRKPIETRAVSLERLDELMEGIRRRIAAGDQIYWVCPLIEESELSDGTPAEVRFAHLKSVFGDRVALLHGRMRADEKDGVTAAFKAGEIPLLVATTVIEVGVDVPNAAIIVIENAERFGLAQLHQLRGRVGRGEKASSCILLYKPPLGETAAARLGILRETEDGFRIAEEDLRLRGAGEMLGTRQSGTPLFRIVRLEAHQHLLEVARKDAEKILTDDPFLESERGQALRNLLYLFSRDEAMQLLTAG